MSDATVDQGLERPDEPEAPQPEAAVEEQPGFGETFWARMSDRANPILVRELHQAIRSRMFQATLLMSLTTIVIIALVVAINVSQEGVSSFGRDSYLAVVVCITPLVMLIVPLSAFNSMRHEVTDGALDHLFMTRLRPGQIIRGKLYATLIQFILYLSVFAPVLALTYLLGGVDVPRIVLTLGFALLFCVTATTAGVLLGAVSRWKAIGSLLFGLGAAALAMTTLSFMIHVEGIQSEIADIVRGSNRDEALLMVLSMIAGTILCGMTAASILTHPYENRSTQFRVFALVLSPLGFLTMLIFIRTSLLDDAFPGYAGIAAATLFLFWLFAATEQSKLSPRVRTMVPKRRELAILSIPFLPGSGRGMLFVILMAAVYLVPGWLLPYAVGQTPDRSTLAVVAIGWLYIIFFVGLMSWFRNRLPQTLRFNWITRGMLVVILAICCFAPLLIDLLTRGRLTAWSMLHVLNPFFTMGALRWQHLMPPLTVMAVLAAIMVVMNLPAMVAGIREVLEESRARREREA